jgi:hypothetical protein
MINRRGLITGLISFVAAPAIVRATSIMPVKAMRAESWFDAVAADLSPDRLEELRAMINREFRYIRVAINENLYGDWRER